jgi:hypothetical protein
MAGNNAPKGRLVKRWARRPCFASHLFLFPPFEWFQEWRRTIAAICEWSEVTIRSHAFVLPAGGNEAKLLGSSSVGRELLGQAARFFVGSAKRGAQ